MGETPDIMIKSSSKKVKAVAVELYRPDQHLSQPGAATLIAWVNEKNTEEDTEVALINPWTEDAEQPNSQLPASQLPTTQLPTSMPSYLPSAQLPPAIARTQVRTEPIYVVTLPGSSGEQIFLPGPSEGQDVFTDQNQRAKEKKERQKARKLEEKKERENKLARDG